MGFSVIIPVYNRPDELDALLESLCGQLNKDFDVIVVEDGSSSTSEKVVEKYRDDIPLTYIQQKNTGPALARNKGAEHAKHEWLLFFDSDCEIPEGYFATIQKFLDEHPDTDFFGGPDREAENFSTLQKGINYAMTSVLTTGGIRGGKKRADLFYPRTFNMGVKKEAFLKSGGFKNLRFGEDLDFSMRLLEMDYTSAYIDEACVIHRRRSGLSAFFKQVFNSGMARIVLEELHPGTLRVIHTLPSFFVVFALFSILLGFYSFNALIPLIFVMLSWFFHALFLTKSLPVALTALLSSFVQLCGYGLGFLRGWILSFKGNVAGEFAFRDTFYE